MRRRAFFFLGADIGVFTAIHSPVFRLRLFGRLVSHFQVFGVGAGRIHGHHVIGQSLSTPNRHCVAELFAEENFAAAYELVVYPQAVLEGAGFGAGARRAGLQAHASRRLKNIGGKRAAIDVEFDAQVAGVADPGDLITGIKDHDFGENSHENWAFGHGESLQATAQSAKVRVSSVCGNWQRQGCQAHVQGAKVMQITSKNHANLDAPVPMIA
jgi:hypothetical protein